MNLNSQINNILRKFESGNKLDSYKELLKIFKKNKDDNLLRYNLAVIQQKLNLNEEAKINYNYLIKVENNLCLLYTSPSPRDLYRSRMPSSA